MLEYTDDGRLREEGQLLSRDWCEKSLQTVEHSIYVGIIWKGWMS